MSVSDSNRQGVRAASSARPGCPVCSSSETVPLAFGFPGPEMMDAADRGEIVLGGCCLPEGPIPRWHCAACRVDFP